MLGWFWVLGTECSVISPLAGRKSNFEHYCVMGGWYITMQCFPRLDPACRVDWDAYHHSMYCALHIVVLWIITMGCDIRIACGSFAGSAVDSGP